MQDDSLAEFPFPAETLVFDDGRGRLGTPSDRCFCRRIQGQMSQVCADCVDEGKYIDAHGLVPPAAASNPRARQLQR